MDMSGMYGGDYVSSTYGGGLKCAFDRIVTLPAEQSDNEGRVRRVDAFATEYFGGRSGGGDGRSVLDVGSGLCVFLHRMKASGWQCTALDPDASAAAHARDTVGVDAVHGDFMIANDLGLYDLVTFNKVLEHVVDPIAMLARARKYVKPEGLVYVELPDGEAAAVEGQGREEFFIDHHHVFSGASLAHLVVRAGFILLRMERLREPSTKYTLVAFMAPAGRVHSPTQES
jgi:2-polyprenyl-3-methyl-5-hydroxy-6-metoxy-1,4-benzoquinol methylase